MKLVDALRVVTRLFLDTAPVIYYVERHPQNAAKADEVFDRIDAQRPSDHLRRDLHRQTHRRHLGAGPRYPLVIRPVTAYELD